MDFVPEINALIDFDTVGCTNRHRRRVSGAWGGLSPPPIFFALQVSGTCRFIHLFTALTMQDKSHEPNLHFVNEHLAGLALFKLQKMPRQVS